MQRSWIRIFGLTMGIPLMFAILVACGSGTGNGGGNTPTAGSTTIKIGTDLPVSGKDASSGKAAEKGAYMAVDQANKNQTIPGIALVLVPKDDVRPSVTHDPAIGAQNVNALVGDALVSGIVGPFNSSVAKAEMPITNQAGLAQISPANTNPCLTKDTADSGCSGANNLLPTLRPTNKVTYFRIATTDDHQGPAGADYMYKVLHLTKVWVIDDTETYGVGIANAFAKQFAADGGTVLGHSSEPGTTTSYVSLLTQIATQHPQGIYFGVNDSTVGILVPRPIPQLPPLQNLPLGAGAALVPPRFPP